MGKMDENMGISQSYTDLKSLIVRKFSGPSEKLSTLIKILEHKQMFWILMNLRMFQALNRKFNI